MLIILPALVTDRGISCQSVVACRIVDLNTRLHVVAEHIESNPIAFVLNGYRLHVDTMCYQIISGKARCDSVHYVITC